jgi:16S rRNA (guanine527-N7)-methyltransferase
VFAEELTTRLRGVINLSSAQVGALAAHYELLCAWNRKLNLTRISGLGEAVERHYCESVFLAVQLAPGPLRICDIGSGAGFPGLPIAVVRPDCSVTLIEAHQRKAVFLREASRAMPNVRVLCSRVEGVTEVFELAVSRAVSYEDLGASLRRLAPLADLMTGADSPPDWLGFEWEPPMPMPWGKQRFVRVGRRVSVVGEGGLR